MASYSAKELQDELSRRAGKKVLLCLTDNRRRMVSTRSRAGGLVEIRLQRIFLESPPEVVAELADMVIGGTRGRTALRSFINERFRETPMAAVSRRPPSAAARAGSHHDIVAMARRLNETYLGGRSRAGVMWGRRSNSRNRRSIRFGCYDPSRNLVIMNRKLDAPDIPAYFVEFILFHELLHEVLGIDSRPDGRRSIHGKLFRLMESTYPDYEKALRFEKEFCRRIGMG